MSEGREGFGSLWTRCICTGFMIALERGELFADTLVLDDTVSPRIIATFHLDCYYFVRHEDAY
jgi:hypothetical protein